MILKKLEELTGNEILAREILSSDYQVILPADAQLKDSYIEKLRDYGIEEIYIKEETPKTAEKEILKTEIKEKVGNAIKDILTRYTYRDKGELEKIGQAADEILTNILEEDRVVEKVFDIRERSADIYEHSINICSLAILTALKMDLKISSVHDIGVGCLLHDIGLNYMAIEYDNRDVGTLDRQELMEYKKHPVYGYSSLRYETWLTELSKDIILYHHEKMDGSGFPTGKKDIPYECRIVNVCDTFDEMICGIGRARVKVHEAVEYLKNFSGILFDEKAVDTFLGFTAVYPAGSHVMTNEGEVAVVLSQNADFPDRPVIQILKDRDGREVKEEIIKNLVKVHNVFIEKAID